MGLKERERESERPLRERGKRKEASRKGRHPPCQPRGEGARSRGRTLDREGSVCDQTKGSAGQRRSIGGSATAGGEVPISANQCGGR